MKKLKIISLNTWKGDGTYTKRLELMGRRLKKLRPDVLCLQESMQSADHVFDTACYLAKRLEMESFFAKARLKKRICEDQIVTCYSGLAILSSLQVLEHKIYALPGTKEDPERIAQYILLQCGEKKIVITNVHLTHLKDAKSLRLEQLRTISRFPFKKMKYDAWLLCGDFNCDWSSSELQTWRREFVQEVSDCYLSGGGGLPATTLVGSPDCRIDYILSLRSADMAEQQFQNAEIVLQRPTVSGLLPSDHYGVSVEFLLAAK